MLQCLFFIAIQPFVSEMEELVLFHLLQYYFIICCWLQSTQSTTYNEIVLQSFLFNCLTNLIELSKSHIIIGIHNDLNFGLKLQLLHFNYKRLYCYQHWLQLNLYQIYIHSFFQLANKCLITCHTSVGIFKSTYSSYASALCLSSNDTLTFSV